MDELIEQLIKVFNPYISQHEVDIYNAKNGEWKKVVYRPVIRATYKDYFDAIGRTHHGIDFSPEQIEKLRYEIWTQYAIPNGTVFYTEGIFIINDSPRVKVHEFAHGNITGKYGIANQVAKLEVEFYNNPDPIIREAIYKIFKKYHEFDEACARCIELIFFDLTEDEVNFRNSFNFIKRVLKEKPNPVWKSKPEREHHTLSLFYLYQQAGLDDFMIKVRKIMESDPNLFFPSSYDTSNFV